MFAPETLGRQKRECVRTTYRDDDSSFQHNTDWVNAAKFPIKYGDITKQPGFQSYMGLISGDRTQYTRNSKGKMVPIKEVGWADAGETPTHIVLQFDSSYGGAYVGSVGTTLWLDNVHVIY